MAVVERFALVAHGDHDAAGALVGCQTDARYAAQVLPWVDEVEDPAFAPVGSIAVRGVALVVGGGECHEFAPDLRVAPAPLNSVRMRSSCTAKMPEKGLNSSADMRRPKT